MHSANIMNSDRLQRLHKVLRKGKWFSTMEIIKKAGICAVNSAVAELRDNGFDVVCEQEGRVWYYRLVG